MKESKSPAEELRDIWLRDNYIGQVSSPQQMLRQLYEDTATRRLEVTAASATLELERSLADAWTAEKILSRVGVSSASASELLARTVQQHEEALQRHLARKMDLVAAEEASMIDLALNAWPVAKSILADSLDTAKLVEAIHEFSESRVSLSDLVDELKTRQLVNAAGEAKASQLLSPLGIDSAAYGTPQISVVAPADKPSALRSIPTFVILFIIALIGHIAAWESLRESIVDMTARLPNTSSLAAAKKFVRQHLSGKPGDVRLTKVADLELRESPDMKAEVVMKLPLYAPVVVLDKQDRTWRLVEYTHEGYIVEGYVSAKFLAKARRD